MELTNRFDLPEVYCQAVKLFESDYDRGKCDYTATQLLRPVRISVLMKRHWQELEEDVSDRLWALAGQVGHLLFQRVAEKYPERYIVEKRCYFDCDGYTVGAKFDCYDIKESVMYDYKESSVFKFLLGDTEDWEKQLNINRLAFSSTVTHVPRGQLSPEKRPVKALKVLVKLKDWKARVAERKKDYPSCPVHIVELPIWSDKEVRYFVAKRIDAFEQGREDPPLCTPDERWERGAKFAVMKKGRKSAVRLFEDEDTAIALAMTEAKYYVEHRKAEPARCKFYCPVWSFCDFGIAAHNDENGTSLDEEPQGVLDLPVSPEG